MDAHVALLRAINVAGRNILPMKDLVALFEAAGCADVRTYIQSGNVVYRAPAALAARLPQLLHARIEERFGLDVPVVTRTARELARAARSNPYLLAGADAAACHLAFLAAKPSAAQIASLDPKRSPPDAFTVVGREIYLHCPKGLGGSKLTNQYFDAKLGTTSTVRNWRTVLTLLEMTAARGD